ncbi:MAG TPA: tRNA (adenosine(37)-N6)-threonylcarbamoyltransferase complex dimerization subunit type 1 TsaB [Rubrivivax sp.]|nr:tRNA (adenosine(37)-N6)-threonylcarbamoyltransferase complex dimerization subunit type 1 TsaB [Rubrivivax sp.]
MATPQFARTPGCLLGFDTSTEVMAVGLQTGERLFTAQAAGGAAASGALLPQIHALLAQAGVRFADLDAVAFGQGPGAFTGLRTACAVAQGIGLAIGKPLLPIDSLLLVAEDGRAQTGVDDVVVLMDARMDEVYAGHYAWQAERWQVLQAPALYALAGLPALCQPLSRSLFAGSALAGFGSRLGLPEASRRCEQEVDRPAALMRLAAQAMVAGQAVDAAQALPLYTRDKVALTTQEREAARAATSLS